MSECTCEPYYEYPKIEQCPLCKAAPELYAALDRLLDDSDLTYAEGGNWECKWCGKVYYESDSFPPTRCTYHRCDGVKARAALDMVKP